MKRPKLEGEQEKYLYKPILQLAQEFSGSSSPRDRKEVQPKRYKIPVFSKKEKPRKPTEQQINNLTIDVLPPQPTVNIEVPRVSYKNLILAESTPNGRRTKSHHIRMKVKRGGESYKESPRALPYI